MATLLIFGASRGTGALVTQYAVEQEHQCIAVVRRQDSYDQLLATGVQAILGDANDAEVVAKASELAGPNSMIISTLGGQQANYQPQFNIINHAEKYGIHNMVLVTSLGCGNSWSTLSDRAKQAFGNAVREKTLAEVWLQTSCLNYAIFRPGGLVDGEPTHNAICYSDQEVHGYVMRSDVALTILQQVKQESLKNTVFSIVDPALVVER